MDDQEIMMLEKKLRRLEPSPMSESLHQKLREELLSTWNFAERLLAGWTVLGAVAACTILCITLWQMNSSAPASPATHAAIVSQKLLDQQMAVVR